MIVPVRHVRQCGASGDSGGCGAGVYPGWGTGVGSWVGTGEGYTGYYPGTLQMTIFSLNLASGPTYGQMKPFLEVSQDIDLR